MIKVRVISGSLKGRTISFPVNKHDNADITPQKVKEALFSVIGEDLTGKSFMDLYAGSGQVGIEALSRGARPVIINEYEKKRFGAIKSFVEGVAGEGEVLLYNMHSFRLIKLLGKRDISADFIFIDIPYIKARERINRYDELLLRIEKGGLLKEEGVVIIQHFGKNIMSEKTGNLLLTETKTYGTNCLSFYREG